MTDSERKKKNVLALGHNTTLRSLRTPEWRGCDGGGRGMGSGGRTGGRVSWAWALSVLVYTA